MSALASVVSALRPAGVAQLASNRSGAKMRWWRRGRRFMGRHHTWDDADWRLGVERVVRPPTSWSGEKIRRPTECYDGGDRPSISRSHWGERGRSIENMQPAGLLADPVNSRT